MSQEVRDPYQPPSIKDRNLPRPVRSIQDEGATAPITCEASRLSIVLAGASRDSDAFTGAVGASHTVWMTARIPPSPPAE